MEVCVVTKRHWISLAVALVAKKNCCSHLQFVWKTPTCQHQVIVNQLWKRDLHHMFSYSLFKMSWLSIRHIFCFEGLKVYLVSHHLHANYGPHKSTWNQSQGEFWDSFFGGQFGMFECSRRVEKCYIRISAFTMFVTNFTWQQPATSSNYLLTSQVKLKSSNLKFYDDDCSSFLRP